MAQEITTISLPLPYRMGAVNCYLIHTTTGRVLIDTGGLNNRSAVLSALAKAGCTPATLKLIVLTHGDFDHCGNAAFCHKLFGVPIAMGHAMISAWSSTPICSGKTGKVNPAHPQGGARPVPLRPGRPVHPDLCIGDGDILATYGLDAVVVHIPGHSKGSIGVLTTNGDLFCGDLFDNTRARARPPLMDDKTAAAASLARLAGLGVSTVYPGHGGPFAFSVLDAAGR